MKRYLGGVCFITDSRLSRLPVAEYVRMVLDSGVRWIQYREKFKPRKDMLSEAIELRTLTAKYGAVFIVNDFVDLAMAVSADGVHLGQDDFPLEEARRLMGKDSIIGISTHSVEEAVIAQKGGADYIGFGPVYHTATKDAGLPRGLGMLKEVSSEIGIPVVAIGGITAESLRDVFGAGASAVAVASAVMNGEIKKNAKVFMETATAC